MKWLRSIVVASVLGAGLFFAASDSADARPRYGRGYWPGYSNYRGYYGGWGGGYYGRGYYGGGYGYPGYYGSTYRYSPGWGYSTPGFYFYYR